MKLSLISILFIFICSFELRAKELDVCNEYNLGWHFYCNKNLEKEQKINPQDLNPNQDDYAQKLAQIKQQLEEKKAKAVIYPSEENIKNYMSYQQMVMDKSSFFADQWRRVLWKNPQLDYTLKRPVSKIAKESWIDQRNQEVKKSIKNNIKLQNIDINNSLDKSINNIGKKIRFGKKSEFELCWYGEAGYIKNYKTDEFFKWGINSIKSLGNVIENKELIKASKLPQNQELEIASKAQKYFKKFEKADFFNISQNKYLQKKLINQQIIEGIKFTKDNKIVLPLQNNKGEIQTLQFIDQNGKKSFLKGGKKQGNYFIVSKNKITQSSTIYLAEGFATAVSINMATNSPVVVAFDAGNIEAVLKNLKEKFADKNFVITADNDLYSEKNIGLQKANLAGQKYGAKVIIPNFHNLVSLNSDINHHLKPTDFNDLHQIAGLEIVKNQIHNSTQMIAKHHEFEMS